MAAKLFDSRTLVPLTTAEEPDYRAALHARKPIERDGKQYWVVEINITLTVTIGDQPFSDISAVLIEVPA